METRIRAFVTFLQEERGASPETIRAYHSDLRQFLSFASPKRASGSAPLKPSDVLETFVDDGQADNLVVIVLVGLEGRGHNEGDPKDLVAQFLGLFGCIGTLQLDDQAAALHAHALHIARAGLITHVHRPAGGQGLCV